MQNSFPPYYEQDYNSLHVRRGEAYRVNFAITLGKLQIIKPMTFKCRTWLWIEDCSRRLYSDIFE